jgi:hypothetical protein
MLESFMVAAGTLSNPLEDHRTLTYIQADWLDSILKFLIHINGKNVINNLRKMQKLRVRDDSIMEKAMRCYDNNSKLATINNCRLFLQITTIAEMFNIEGTHILEEAYHGSINRTGLKTIQRHSRSTLCWPKQPQPPEKAWRIWRKWISTFLPPKLPSIKITTYMMANQPAIQTGYGSIQTLEV